MKPLFGDFTTPGMIAVSCIASENFNSAGNTRRERKNRPTVSLPKSPCLVCTALFLPLSYSSYSAVHFSIPPMSSSSLSPPTKLKPFLLASKSHTKHLPSPPISPFIVYYSPSSPSSNHFSPSSSSSSSCSNPNSPSLKHIPQTSLQPLKTETSKFARDLTTYLYEKSTEIKNDLKKLPTATMVREKALPLLPLSWMSCREESVERVVGPLNLDLRYEESTSELSYLLSPTSPVPFIIKAKNGDEDEAMNRLLGETLAELEEATREIENRFHRSTVESEIYGNYFWFYSENEGAEELGKLLKQ